MATEVKRLAETIQVTDVGSIAVTEIADEAGQKVRAIRIFASGSQTGLPILEIQVRAATADPIRITTPEIKF